MPQETVTLRDEHGHVVASATFDAAAEYEAHLAKLNDLIWSTSPEPIDDDVASSEVANP